MLTQSGRMLSTAMALTVVLAGAARAAPVLEGPPPRALTDPHAIASPRILGAGPAAIADLFSVRGAPDGTWSHDGRTIVFTTNLTGRYNVWAMPATGGFPVQLAQSDDRQTGIVATAQDQVVFQSDRAGAEIYDLFATPLAGGDVANLTATPEISESGAVASRDGRLLAFARRPKAAPSSDIAVMDMTTRAVRVLTHEAAPDRTWAVAGFTADGRRLVATRADFNRTHATVYAIDVATGAQTALTPDDGANRVAEGVSPDGAVVALTVEDAKGMAQAATLDVASRRITLVKPDLWEEGSAGIAPDGRTLLFTTNVDGRQTLSAQDLASRRSRVLPLPEGFVDAASPKGASFSPDGRRVLAWGQAGSTSIDYWVVDLDGASATRITRLGLASLTPGRLPPSQVVHYASADGTVVSALLWTPFNLARDGRAPAVVLPHGGPTGQTVDTFNRTAIALASRGYMVLAPNPRGSTGYGRAFQDANRKDLGGGDLEDEVAGARFLVATGYVDKGRIGITGGSYGGYMTLMALAKTPDIWAAGVEQYGIIDWATMYRTESPTLQQYQRGLLGAPDEDAAVYRAASPMTFIHQLKAPLLVLQGDNDIRVPKGQAEMVAATLKADGRTVEAHYYPNEGHGFVKRENQIDALTRTVAWFDAHLKP